MRTSGTSPACFHLQSLVSIYFKDLVEYREYSVFFSQGERGMMDFQRKASMRLVLFFISFLKREVLVKSCKRRSMSYGIF